MSQNTEPVEKEMKELTASYQADKLEFIKNPVIAEFLALASNADFTESELEQRLLHIFKNFLWKWEKDMLLLQDSNTFAQKKRITILTLYTDEDIAKYSILHGHEQLFASKYKTCLPSEEQLREEIEIQKRFYYLQKKEDEELGEGPNRSNLNRMIRIYDFLKYEQKKPP